MTCSILILPSSRAKFFNLGFALTNSAQFPMAMLFRARWLTFSARSEIVFVTGGLGPTSDDITRELVAGHLKLPLIEDATVHEANSHPTRCAPNPNNGTDWRQALVPGGAKSALPREWDRALGLYLPASINPAVPSPHLFCRRGQAAELQPLPSDFVALRFAPDHGRIGEKWRCGNFSALRTWVSRSLRRRLAGPHCRRPSKLSSAIARVPVRPDVRVIGSAEVVAQAEEIIRKKLGSAIFTASDETRQPFLSACSRSGSKPGAGRVMHRRFSGRSNHQRPGCLESIYCRLRYLFQ